MMDEHTYSDTFKSYTILITTLTVSWLLCSISAAVYFFAVLMAEEKYSKMPWCTGFKLQSSPLL